jgi:AraC-like DNA-binding protein
MSLSFRHYRSETLSHSHDDFHQIIVSHHGVLDLDVEGAGGAVRGRQIAFVPAGARHAYRAQGMNRFLVIDLDANLAARAGIEQLWQQAGGGAYLSVPGAVRLGELESMFGGATHLDLAPCAASVPMTMTTGFQMPRLHSAGQSAMIGFLADLLRNARRGQGHNQGQYDAHDNISGEIPPRLRRAMEWAAARLNEPLSIAEMAKIAALSESALFAGFERHVGCAPMRWLGLLRLDRGRDLLADPKNSETIADIARQVGFQDQAAFSRAFSRRFAVAPGRFRKQCQVP